MKILIEIGAARHVLDVIDGSLDLSGYPQTGQEVLQTAYDAGHWQPYEPPQAEPEPLPPDWPAFRLALLHNAAFRTWSEALPATWREDLKLAAIAANAEALQSIYTHCTTLHSPGHTAATEWQQIADHHRIPITF